jgi:hypothetical protein
VVFTFSWLVDFKHIEEFEIPRGLLELKANLANPAAIFGPI